VHLQEVSLATTVFFFFSMRDTYRGFRKFLYNIRNISDTVKKTNFSFPSQEVSHVIARKLLSQNQGYFSCIYKKCPCSQLYFCSLCQKLTVNLENFFTLFEIFRTLWRKQIFQFSTGSLSCNSKKTSDDCKFSKFLVTVYLVSEQNVNLFENLPHSPYWVKMLSFSLPSLRIC
jgi:hypothetical protein